MKYQSKTILNLLIKYARYKEIKLSNGVFVSFNISLLIDSKEEKILKEFLKELKQYDE